MTGIPMRRARQSTRKNDDSDDDTSVTTNQNKRVTLCFRGWEGSHLLDEREQIRHDDSIDRCNPKLRIDTPSPSSYERRRTLPLVWIKPPKHWCKNALTSCCVHRVTTSVPSSPSSACLLRHILHGKPVTLALRAGLTVSYVLLAHGHEVYLHCMHQSLLQPTALPPPKRMTTMIGATSLSSTSRMTTMIMSSLLNHAWIGVTPPTLDSGFDRVFPKATLEGSVIPTSVRLELATRDASIVMGQSLLWDKSYPKVYGITQICLPSLQLATPLTRAQLRDVYDGFRQFADHSLGIKYRLFDRSKKTGAPPITRHESFPLFRRLWDELHQYMIRYGQESSVHARMRDLVNQTRTVMIDMLDTERLATSDRTQLQTGGATATSIGTGASDGNNQSMGNMGTSMGMGMSGAPVDIAAEQKAQIDALQQSWALLDNLSDMAESQRVRALHELSTNHDNSNDDTKCTPMHDSSDITTTALKRRRQQSQKSDSSVSVDVTAVPVPSSASSSPSPPPIQPTSIDITQRKRKRDDDTTAPSSSPLPSPTSSSTAMVGGRARLGSSEFVCQPLHTLVDELLGEPVLPLGGTSLPSMTTTGMSTGLNTNGIMTAASVAVGLGTAAGNRCVTLLEQYWMRQQRLTAVTHLKSSQGPREFAGRLPSFVYKW